MVSDNLLLVENNLFYDRCPLCGFIDISKVGRGGLQYQTPLVFATRKIKLTHEPELWKCHKCKSGFVQNIIPEKTALSLYADSSANERWISAPFDKEKPQVVLKQLNNVFIKNQNILDIGCNTGELLDFARCNGCYTSGIELSQTSIAILKNKGHRVYQTLNDVRTNFDVITAFDLVEHCYDLPKFLSNCSRLLNPNGILVILTGDIACISSKILKEKWWYVRYPEHIIFPSQEYFGLYSGFKIIKYIHTYNSTGYQLPSLHRIIGILAGLLRANYSGIPSVGHDHILVVLQKTEGISEGIAGKQNMV